MLLHVLVFVCGAAMMALEILGARVLAPTLGNSIFVWGALISSFMVAMSAGYWLGGVISEKAAHMKALGLAAASGGLLAIAVPRVAGGVLPRAAMLGPRTGPLAASMAVFFLPTLVLATISPIAVRVAARDARGVGRTAGGLYSLSTAGSILGTLGTAFWLIPAAPVDTLIVATGLLLVAAGTIAAFAPGADPRTAVDAGRGWAVAVGCVAVVGIMLGVGSLDGRTVDAREIASGEHVVYRTDTQYHRITVIDRGTVRALKFDNRRQSAVDMRDGYTSDIRYTDYLHLAMAVKPHAKRVLVLGLGGGALPMRMVHDYPGVAVDSVEIDPVVVTVARRYFNMPANDPRLRVFVGDARQYVARTKDRYDIVVIDAYYSDSLPFHLATAEFFRQVDGILEPGGVVAYNVISAVDGPKSSLFRSIYRTAGGVWRTRYAFPIGIAGDGDAAKVRNIVVLATDSPLSPTALQERIRSRVDGAVSVPGFASFAGDMYMRAVPVADVPTLTDRYAPVDSLIHLD